MIVPIASILPTPARQVWRHPLRVVVGVMACALLMAHLAAPAAAQPASFPGPVADVIEQGEAAGADGALLREAARRAQAQNLSPEATAELLRPAVRLARANLPSTSVLNKTLEGLAKRVPPPRVRPVVDRLAGHVEAAGPVVDGWLDRPDVRGLLGDAAAQRDVRNNLIASSAQAQQHGMPMNEVKALLDALPASTTRRPLNPGHVAAAVRVLPDVPGASSSPSAARELLVAAVDAGYSTEEVGQLPAALRRAQAESRRPPATLSRNAAQAIAQGIPAQDVLQSLYRGEVPGRAPNVERGPGSDGPPPGQGTPPGQGKPPDPGRGGPPDDPPGGPPGGNPPGNPPGHPPGDPPGNPSGNPPL